MSASAAMREYPSCSSEVLAASICSGGMSSAIVVKAIKAEAAKQDFDLDMIAVGSGAVEDALKEEDYKLLRTPACTGHSPT